MSQISRVWMDLRKVVPDLSLERTKVLAVRLYGTDCLSQEQADRLIQSSMIKQKLSEVEAPVADSLLSPRVPAEYAGYDQHLSLKKCRDRLRRRPYSVQQLEMMLRHGGFQGRCAAATLWQELVDGTVTGVQAMQTAWTYAKNTREGDIADRLMSVGNQLPPVEYVGGVFCVLDYFELRSRKTAPLLMKEIAAAYAEARDRPEPRKKMMEGQLNLFTGVEDEV